MASPLKSLFNIQWGRVSSALGNSIPDPIATSSNQSAAPLVDNNGRVITRLADENGFIDIGTFTEFTSGAARSPTAGVTVEAVPLVRLESIWGYNGNLVPTLFFLHIYDIIAPPTPGLSTPLYIVPVPGNFATFSFSERISLSSGYTVAASSTEFIFTPLAAADLWFATTYYI
jgi:hypothetical protein